MQWSEDKAVTLALCSSSSLSFTFTCLDPKFFHLLSWKQVLLVSIHSPCTPLPCSSPSSISLASLRHAYFLMPGSNASFSVNLWTPPLELSMPFPTSFHILFMPLLQPIACLVLYYDYLCAHFIFPAREQAPSVQRPWLISLFIYQKGQEQCLKHIALLNAVGHINRAQRFSAAT